MATANLFESNGKREMDKAKALESALAQIERQFGKGSIMKLGQDNAVMDVEATSTGSLGLDIALGIVSARRCHPRPFPTHKRS